MWIYFSLIGLVILTLICSPTPKRDGSDSLCGHFSEMLHTKTKESGGLGQLLLDFFGTRLATLAFKKLDF